MKLGGEMKNRIKKILMNILWVLPRATAHKILYYVHFRKKLSLKNPQTFNEKLHFLMVYRYGASEGRLADKVEVKDILKEKKIDGLYIPKTLHVYKTAEEINIDELPNKFVLKCNHGSGEVYICRNKDKFDIERAKEGLRKTLKQNFAKSVLEYHYSYINPMIIAEEFLDDDTGKGAVDYKFYCFDGKPVYLYVSEGLEDHRTARIEFFDMDFNPAPFSRSDYKRFEEKPNKPVNFEKMKKIATELAKGKSFVRVDLYNIKGKIYFGELTFSPCAGLMPFDPPEWDRKLGDMLKISKERKPR